MSPAEAGAVSLVTVIDGGSRSGRDWKCWTPFGPADHRDGFANGISPDGFAMAKLNVPFVPPSTFRPVVTVTVSPGANGVSGRKLPPWPSESAAT